MNHGCWQCADTGWFTFSGSESCDTCGGSGSVPDYTYPTNANHTYNQSAGWAVCWDCAGSRQKYVTEHRRCDACDSATRQWVGAANPSEEEYDDPVPGPGPTPLPSSRGASYGATSYGTLVLGSLLWLGGLAWLASYLPGVLPSGVLWRRAAIYGALAAFVVFACLFGIGPFRGSPAGGPRRALTGVVWAAIGLALAVLASAWVARSPGQEFWLTAAATLGALIALACAMRSWLLGSTMSMLTGLAVFAVVGLFAPHIPGACLDAASASLGPRGVRPPMSALWPGCSAFELNGFVRTLEDGRLVTDRALAILLGVGSLSAAVLGGFVTLFAKPSAGAQPSRWFPPGLRVICLLGALALPFLLAPHAPRAWGLQAQALRDTPVAITSAVLTPVATHLTPWQGLANAESAGKNTSHQVRSSPTPTRSRDSQSSPAMSKGNGGAASASDKTAPAEGISERLLKDAATVKALYLKGARNFPAPPSATGPGSTESAFSFRWEVYDRDGLYAQLSNLHEATARQLAKGLNPGGKPLDFRGANASAGYAPYVLYADDAKFTLIVPFASIRAKEPSAP
jgi:hypothetical protein